MERIVINGVPVEVPKHVVAEGRAAVAHWHEAVLAGASPESLAEPAAAPAAAEPAPEPKRGKRGDA